MKFLNTYSLSTKPTIEQITCLEEEDRVTTPPLDSVIACNDRTVRQPCVSRRITRSPSLRLYKTVAHRLGDTSRFRVTLGHERCHRPVILFLGAVSGPDGKIYGSKQSLILIIEHIPRNKGQPL